MRKVTLAATILTAFAPTVLAQVTYSQTEINNSRHLKQIGIPDALQYAGGLNVNVGVIDSGIAPNNPDLQTQIATAVRPANFTSAARNNLSDVFGHGTHVAGIIAAAANGAGVVGVAPLVKVVPIKVIGTNGSASMAALGAGLRYAADSRLPIANLSLGGGPCCWADIKYATDRGVLLVAAAGNEGAANPAYAARYSKERWAQGRIIAVGSVDAHNRISSFSNRAGDTQDFFLVAPGEYILSTVSNRLSYKSGTSMATPMVAGAAALIKSRWSYLRPDQIADALFKSADDLGTPGVDAIFGRGLLNVARALQPIGKTVMPTQTGSVVAAKSIVIKAPATYAAALKSTTARMVEIDEIGRDFPLHVADTVTTPRRNTLTHTLATPAVDPAKPNAWASNAERMISVNFNSTSRLAVGDASSSAAFLSHTPHTKSAHHTDNATAATFLTQTPVLSLMPAHTLTGVAHTPRPGLIVKFAALNTAGAEFLDGPGAQKLAPARATVGFVSHVNDKRMLGLTVAALKERDTLLGGSASGFGLGAPDSMVFTTADALFNLGSQVSLLMQMTSAHSSGSGESAQTYGATALRASAAKFGLVKGPAKQGQGTLAVSVEQPLRVSSGALNATLPSAVNEAGEVLFERTSIDLAALAREVQYRVEYGNVIGKHAYATGFLQLNQNPGHDPSAPSEAIVGLKMSKNF